MSDKIIVRNTISDMIAFTRLVPIRRKKIRDASPAALPVDPVNRAVAALHPELMYLRIDDVIQETETTKSFILKPDSDKGTATLSPFRAGQYLNIRIEINGSVVSRNYSLSSTPADAADGFYRITVRKKEKGFATSFILDSWKKGTNVISSGPVGTFVYESLRDSRQIVAIAGGCGITPIISMARDSAQKKDNRAFTIIYGVRNTSDIIFRKQLAELAEKNPERIKIHYVASEPEPGWKGPAGFITAELIAELVGTTEGKSFFLCGPQAMYRFLDVELAKLSIPRRFLRRELFGEIDDPTSIPGFPRENLGKRFGITVHIADESVHIEGSGTETVLVALERAGLAPPSRCRSGECGWCRSRLVSGKVFINPENDGRRIADRKFGWFHPCSSYPASDLEIRVPRSAV